MLSAGRRENYVINMLILSLKEVKGVFTSKLLYLINHQFICFFVTFVFREIDKKLDVPTSVSFKNWFKTSTTTTRAVECVVFMSREVNRGIENALK